MVFETEEEKKAKRFISQVKGILSRQDGLIYEVESSVETLNVISPSNVGKRDAYVIVTLYNVSSPEDALSSDAWYRLGEIGAQVDKRSHVREPTIEFYKRFG